MIQLRNRQFLSNSAASPVYHLKSRGIIKVQGQDTVPFLQGLVTNDVSLLGSEVRSQYSMLLNVQGRVICDLMLYTASVVQGQESTVLMECDRTLMEQVISTLKKYKIRRKVSVEDICGSHRVLSSCDPAVSIVPGGDAITVTDPRVPAFGSRIIINNDSPIEIDISEDERGYHERRLQWGIPEGVHDLPPGSALPLEGNLVYMNGVSFSKGCYLGQELTARTHHTGVTRKRLMPVVFDRDPGSIEPGQDILNASTKSVGKFRSVIGLYGIGLMRVAEISGELTLANKSGETIYLNAVKPNWWPNEGV